MRLFWSAQLFYSVGGCLERGQPAEGVYRFYCELRPVKTAIYNVSTFTQYVLLKKEGVKMKRNENVYYIYLILKVITFDLTILGTDI